MFEAAYTTIEKIQVHVAVVTKVCICSHSPFRSGQDYSTRLFVYASYPILLVLGLVGGILLSLSFFCIRKTHVLCYIAILLCRSLPIGHCSTSLICLQWNQGCSLTSIVPMTSFFKHRTSNWKYMLLTDTLNCAI